MVKPKFDKKFKKIENIQKKIGLCAYWIELLFFFSFITQIDSDKRETTTLLINPFTAKHEYCTNKIH